MTTDDIILHIVYLVALQHYLRSYAILRRSCIRVSW
jgi:hypothetical protein